MHDQQARCSIPRTRDCDATSYQIPYVPFPKQIEWLTGIVARWPIFSDMDNVLLHYRHRQSRAYGAPLPQLSRDWRWLQAVKSLGRRNSFRPSIFTSTLMASARVGFSSGLKSTWDADTTPRPAPLLTEKGSRPRAGGSRGLYPLATCQCLR